MQEEIFGPVLSIVHVDTLDEAIGVVNRSRFGNGTSIFTENGAAVRRYRHEVEAGMIGVNIGVAAPVAFFPFSGWKDSFLGDLHAHGPDAVDFFTRKKTVTTRYFSSGQTQRGVLRRELGRQTVARRGPRRWPADVRRSKLWRTGRGPHPPSGACDQRRLSSMSNR